MKYLIVSLLSLLCLSCVPMAYTSGSSNESNKSLVYDNMIYEQDIATVQLYPTRFGRIELAQPSVISFDQQNPLLLSFDHLYHDVEDFRIRFIHCNSDWTPSNYSNLDILKEYNEFMIQEYEQSFNTRTPYIHYTFNLPRLSVTGNYLLVVYRGGNTNDIILTRRFMVMSNQLVIRPDFRLSSSVIERNFNQQIDFTVAYPNLDIVNPSEELIVIIRQNARWDNAIINLKPYNIDEFKQQMNFELFDLSNNFKGGNEFRFFDLRSILAPGQNINNVDYDETRVTANLMIDRSRKMEAYTILKDLNGAYIVERFDSEKPEIDGDYATVNFFLKVPKVEDGELYLLGAMNDWKREWKNRMVYSEEFGGYVGSQFLKQGWYNYIYSLDNSKLGTYHFEGSHYQTENLYEIFVYYRPIGSRGDQLIGYHRSKAQNILR